MTILAENGAAPRAGPAAPPESDTPLSILLLSFGSARDEADVPAYLAGIRGAHRVTDALVADVQARYRRIGRSPLEAVSRLQAGRLQMRLDPAGRGSALVRAAMLHSEPDIPSAVEELLASGSRRIVALPLAPQVSPHHHAYLAAVTEAAAGRAEVHLAGSWHRHELLLSALAERVVPLLGPLCDREPTTVLFTAHSLPLVAPDVAGYRHQVAETAAALAARLGLRLPQWRVAFQSRSGPAALWLGPDLLDTVGELSRSGTRRLVVVPVQFVSDHLEVLYDLDVATRETAEAAGIQYLRPALLNASPALVRTLADVAAATLERDGVAWRRPSLSREAGRCLSSDPAG